MRIFKSMFWLLGVVPLICFADKLSKDDIPVEVVKNCYDANGRVADFSAKWEATDVVTNKNLPRSRLVGACQPKNGLWKISCETGGRGHSYKLVTMQKKDDGEWARPQITNSMLPPTLGCHAKSR